jgi:hypothetical protein
MSSAGMYGGWEGDNAVLERKLTQQISELRQTVIALQGQMDIILKRLEQSGALYNGAVAYSGTFVQSSLPKSYDGFNFGVNKGIE